MCSAASLDGTPRSHPGCAVAVARASSGYLAACRADAPRLLEFHRQNGPGRHPLAYALFVYGWLAAGRPLDAIDPPVLAAAAGLRHPAWLAEADVLSQVTVGKRNRAFEAREIINAFTDLERQLASPGGDTRSSEPSRPTPPGARIAC